MYNPSTIWTEQLKNLIKEVAGQREFVLDGIVTSVNPNPPYSVKVTLEPYQIETGWLKIITPFIGNGFGFVVPPPPEGTHVKVLFDMGDVNHGTVIGGIYNDKITAQPNINFGDAALYHQSGSYITLAKDGSVVITSKSGASITLSGTQKQVTINGTTSQSW